MSVPDARSAFPKRRKIDGAAQRKVIVIGTVDLKVICTASVSVNGETSTVRIRSANAVSDHAGDEKCERVKTVSCSVGWKVLNPTGIDRARDLRLFGLQHLFLVRRDRNGRIESSGFNRDINAAHKADLYSDASLNKSLKSCLLNRYRVTTRYQRTGRENSLTIRRSGYFAAGTFIFYLD